MGVDVRKRAPGRKVPIAWLKKTGQEILEILEQNRTELSIAVVDNGEIQELNARYRNRDEPTDVLSFSAERRLPAGTEVLGDVVISVEKAEEQARKRGETLEQEMTALLIHGVLHLLGYDHERSRRDARIMRALEKKVSRALERFVRSRS